MISLLPRQKRRQDLTLHFQRFEFKYVIDEEIERGIKARIRSYVVHDSYAAQQAGKAYEVVSLYYDTPQFYYYHQKIDGVKKRKKIRLRTYRNNGQWNRYAFFEIKRRHDAIVLKDRFVMSESDYHRVVSRDDFYGTNAVQDQHKKNIIDEFEWERHLRSILPKIIVLYKREPYVGKYHPHFRVTFDKHIRAKEGDDVFSEADDFVEVLHDPVVMEIKYTGSLPFYLSDVIQEFGLQREAFSKYCKGVEACASLAPTTTAFPQGICEAVSRYQGDRLSR